MFLRLSPIVLCCAALLALSGCVDRAQADKKLASACEAGVKALLPRDEKIDRIADSTFKDSPTGPNHRHVTIAAIMDSDWLEDEVAYECVFEESFGFLNMHYTASIYQVHLQDRVVGKAGNKILGDADDFLKLTDAIREALYD